MQECDKERFRQVFTETYRNSRLAETKKFVQHGSTSVFEHSLSVAYNSYRLAKFLHIKVHERDLIRGALLHDYFLYDWHDKDHAAHRLHGFTHPSRSYDNACRDFELTDIERNLIVRHMFPLTVVPPVCREAWIVCLIDKVCSVSETFNLAFLRKRTV